MPSGKKILCASIRLGSILVFLILLFFSPIGNIARIYYHQSEYFDWVERNYLPLSFGIPSLAPNYQTKLRLIRYGPYFFPWIHVVVPFGKNDGVLEFYYVLDINGNFNPQGVREKIIQLTFYPIAHPATDFERAHNVGCGCSIYPEDVSRIIKRINAGDRLMDYRAYIIDGPDKQPNPSGPHSPE